MQPSDARTLRGAAIPSALAGVAAVLAGLLLAGVKGALGAAIATVVVIAFFSISVVAVSYASKISAQMMFAAAVFSYITKIFVMFALVAAFQNVTLWNSEAFGWSVIALTLVWIAAEIRVTLKTKTLYVEPVEAPEPTADRSP
jgi:ATP synthase protein I